MGVGWRVNLGSNTKDWGELLCAVGKLTGSEILLIEQLGRDGFGNIKNDRDFRGLIEKPKHPFYVMRQDTVLCAPIIPWHSLIGRWTREC